MPGVSGWWTTQGILSLHHPISQPRCEFLDQYQSTSYFNELCRPCSADILELKGATIVHPDNISFRICCTSDNLAPMDFVNTFPLNDISFLHYSADLIVISCPKTTFINSSAISLAILTISRCFVSLNLDSRS